MISILNNIAQRAKKLLLLLIIIPLLTAAVSYYLESKKPTTYTAVSTIEVGNFNNERLADPVVIETQLNTTKSLEQIKKITNGNFDVDHVKSRLLVTSPSPTEKKIIKFQYTGTDKKEVETTLHDLALGYEKLRNEEYQSKNDNLEENKEILNLVDSDALKNAADQPDVIAKFAEVNNSIGGITYYKTTVLDQSVSASYSNPLKRALFGIILGLMLNVVILVTPELFREYR
jgi:teichuronic acid biosynthesis protein TuaF